MPDYLLHIQVKPEAERLAVETLVEIERLSHQDRGCVSFMWLQHESDPCRFTLVEQWDTKENLEEHLEKIIPRWQVFEPNLVGEPLSEPVRPVRVESGSR